CGGYAGYPGRAAVGQQTLDPAGRLLGEQRGGPQPARGADAPARPAPAPDRRVAEHEERRLVGGAARVTVAEEAVLVEARECRRLAAPDGREPGELRGGVRHDDDVAEARDVARHAAVGRAHTGPVDA